MTPRCKSSDDFKGLHSSLFVVADHDGRMSLSSVSILMVKHNYFHHYSVWRRTKKRWVSCTTLQIICWSTRKLLCWCANTILGLLSNSEPHKKTSSSFSPLSVFCVPFSHSLLSSYSFYILTCHSYLYWHIKPYAFLLLSMFDSNKNNTENFEWMASGKLIVLDCSTKKQLIV